VGPICWQLFAIVVGSGIFVGFRASTFNNMSERIAQALRKDFYESVLNKDVEFFELNRTGDLCKFSSL
jgi:ABC-type bacteriocin/lantibiotic exporter with double-glycine peptidase domain